MSRAISTTRGYLLNDDCMVLLKNLKSDVVDCVFADPPFNLGKQYGVGITDIQSDSDYLSWLKTWISECIRVLKPGGSLFLYNIPKWQIQVGAWLMQSGVMHFRHWISISMKNTPPRGNNLYPAHYGLLYFTKGEPGVFNRDAVRTPIPRCRNCGKPIPDWGGYKSKLHPLGVNLTDVWEDIDGAPGELPLSDVWSDTHPVRHKRYKVRAVGVNELDPKIPERAILLSTNPGDVVLDPFGGGGTTYRVAEKHGRLWIGTEIGECERIREGLVRSGAVLADKPPEGIRKLFQSKLMPNAAPMACTGDD